MNPDEYLNRAKEIKKRIDHVNWKERKDFLIKKAGILRKEAAKKFHTLQKEHCDDCSEKEECFVCEPEFDKMRKSIEILGDLK